MSIKIKHEIIFEFSLPEHGIFSHWFLSKVHFQTPENKNENAKMKVRLRGEKKNQC